MKSRFCRKVILASLAIPFFACSERSEVGVNRTRAAPLADGRYIFAALNNGSVHVYAIDSGHQEVAAFDTSTGVRDVRGVCASAQTGMFYIAHQAASAGYVIAVDIYSDTVQWNRAYLPNVDRLSCTPDGQKLYVPCNESYEDDCLIVLDA